MAKKSWSDLTPSQQRAVVVLGVVEVALSAWAARDLKSRTSEQVRGPKLLWLPALAVQPVGPVAYLLLGRRRA